MIDYTYAKVAYDGFYAAAPGVTVPVFDEVNDDTKNAWYASATALVNFFTAQPVTDVKTECCNESVAA